MKTHVESDVCIGCGVCVSMCPQVFTLNEDGISEAKNQKVSEDDKEIVLQACEACPVAAIVVEDMEAMNAEYKKEWVDDGSRL